MGLPIRSVSGTRSSSCKPVTFNVTGVAVGSGVRVAEGVGADVDVGVRVDVAVGKGIVADASVPVVAIGVAHKLSGSVEGPQAANSKRQHDSKL